jgi:DNA (cytosine-5)-methyltransferase 1
MKHGSLFSGIGGFDLASEWMGWENIFHCEIAEFPRKVLHYYWPNSISYENIKETDFTIHKGGIDILTGGFPCQPFSMAGKRKGTEDERHLWPEMLRAIREIQPRWIVGENVFGLVNWDAGLVFEQVQSDLETQGYEVQAFILPAAAVNAPHRRDRVWFVAYTDRRGNARLQCELGKLKENRQRREDNEKDSFNNVTDTLCVRQQGQRWPKKSSSKKTFGNGKATWSNDDGRWPIEPAVRRRDDGFPERLDSITFSNWAKESIKAYGNAIVPQVAYQIFKSISKY